MYVCVYMSQHYDKYFCATIDLKLVRDKPEQGQGWKGNAPSNRIILQSLC